VWPPPFISTGLKSDYLKPKEAIMGFVIAVLVVVILVLVIMKLK